MEAELDTAAAELTDDLVVARVRAGETDLFELLMRKYNRRLYRAARAILRDDQEAEDALQDAYMQAYLHLDQFEGRAQLSSWLTRIVVNEALRRARRRDRAGEVEKDMSDIAAPTCGPEEDAVNAELRRVLERAVDALPAVLRTAFVLRDVENLSTAEAAECLGIPEETVKTRLHRARVFLRQSIRVRFGEAAQDAFPFGFSRCDRVVTHVMARIAALGASRDGPR